MRAEDVVVRTPGLGREPLRILTPPDQPWWKYSAAPWSITQRLPCQSSRFGLRQERSTFATNASSHSTRPGSAPEVGTWPSKPNEPGRKSAPRLSPGLALSRSWTSWSAS